MLYSSSYFIVAALIPLIPAKLLIFKKVHKLSHFGYTIWVQKIQKIHKSIFVISAGLLSCHQSYLLRLEKSNCWRLQGGSSGRIRNNESREQDCTDTHNHACYTNLLEMLRAPKVVPDVHRGNCHDPIVVLLKHDWIVLGTLRLLVFWTCGNSEAKNIGYKVNGCS